MRVYWRVKVWDQDGQPSAWSEPATWSMGLLHPEDWKAKWIGKEETGEQQDPAQSVLEPEAGVVDRAGDRRSTPATVFFRLSFEVPAGRTLVDAIAVLGGDRGGEFYLNGNRIGKINRYGRPSVASDYGGIEAGQERDRGPDFPDGAQPDARPDRRDQTVVRSW